MNSLAVFKKMIQQQREELTDLDIVTSTQFAEHLTSMARVLCDAWHYKGRAIMVKILKNANFVAQTDGGRYITINAGSEVMDGMDMVHRAIFMIGLNLHEVGHILFTNTQKERLIIDKMCSVGNMARDCDAVNNYLVNAGQNTRKLVANVFHMFANCIEDGHVEWRMLQRFPNWAPYLQLCRDVQLYQAENNPVSKMLEQSLPSKSIFFNLLLIYAKYRVEVYEETDIEENAVALFQSIEPLVDMAVSEKDSEERLQLICEAFNAVFLALIQKPQSQSPQAEQKQSGNGQSQMQGSGSSVSTNEDENQNQGDGQPSDEQLSEDEIEELMNQLSMESGDLGQDETQDNEEALSGSPCSDESKVPEGDLSLKGEGFTPTSLEAMLKNITNQIAEDKAVEAVDNESISKMQILRNNLDFGDYHRNVTCTLSKETGEKSPTYNDDMLLIKPILRRLLGEFKKNVQEMQNGGRINGLYFGRKLTQPYRTDFKRFSKNIAPENRVNMSVLIYIDQSGSMEGEKENAARRLAILVYLFCKELGVDIAIYGHHAYNKKVSLIQYCDFGSFSKHDLAHISNVKAYDSCNRDGYGLRLCAEQLAKQSTDKKLLFVISDGIPNDDNYDIRNATEDIHEILKLYQRKGISFITAGLLDDAASIKSIYTDGLSIRVASRFLDISNLEDLPKRITNIIKKAILQ